MSVLRRLLGIHRTHFLPDILRFENGCVNFSLTIGALLPLSLQRNRVGCSISLLVSYKVSIFSLKTQPTAACLKDSKVSRGRQCPRGVKEVKYTVKCCTAGLQHTASGSERSACDEVYSS